MTGRVELDEVQGNVLHAYGGDFPHAEYVRFSVASAQGACALLRRWTRRVSFGRRPKGTKRPPHLNVALTFGGLRALGVPADVLAAFPKEFCEGAHARAASLGDRWPLDHAFDPGDLMLVVHAATASDLKGFVAELQAEVDGPGAPLVHVDTRAASLPASAREHFGFADGASQPAVEGVDTDPVGDGVYSAVVPRGGPLLRRIGSALEDLGVKPVTRRWRLVRTGEFVLGYENEDERLPAGPPAPLGPNGTFMVYREMPQHVSVFRDYVRQKADELGMDEEVLGAKIVGRFTDGTPIAVSRAPDPVIASSRERENHFLYAGDREGYRCPVGAHVRRTNPRDGLGGGADRTARHRIIRRGLPFGTAEDGGLVFVCFQSSIANGFEFIQREWINRGDGLGIGPDPDFLLQQASGKDGRPTGRMVLPGHRTAVLDPPEEPFVTVSGCAYLFVPSRRACEWLGRLHTD